MLIKRYIPGAVLESKICFILNMIIQEQHVYYLKKITAQLRQFSRQLTRSSARIKFDLIKIYTPKIRSGIVLVAFAAMMKMMRHHLLHEKQPNVLNRV